MKITFEMLKYHTHLSLLKLHAIKMTSKLPLIQNRWKIWHSDYLNVLDNRSIVNVNRVKKKKEIAIKYSYCQSYTEHNNLDENSRYFCIFHDQHLNTGIILKTENYRKRTNSKWMPQTIHLKQFIKHTYLFIIYPLVIKTYMN